MLTELAELPDPLWWCAGGQRAEFARDGEQRAGLVARHREALGQSHVGPALESDIGRLAVDQSKQCRVESLHALDRQRWAVADERLGGQGDQRVAGQDRGGHAVDRPRGRAMPPGAVFIHHVVVQQRVVVREFDGDSCVGGLTGRAADGLGRQHRQRGPYRLAGIPVQRAAVFVPPAEVVADHLARRRVHPVRRRPQAGCDQLAGPVERGLSSGHRSSRAERSPVRPARPAPVRPASSSR